MGDVQLVRHEGPRRNAGTNAYAGSIGYSPSRSAAEEAEAQRSASGKRFASGIMARTPEDRHLAIFRSIALCKRYPDLIARAGRQTAAGALAPRLLERAGDLVEHGADLRADSLDGDDDEHRNQARDQRILDRRHAGFIAKEVSNSKHGILLTLYGPLRS